jgi:hypothetical protein
VSPYQKIRQDSGALPALPAIRPPSAAREKFRFSRECLNPDLGGLQKGIAVPLAFKMDAKFSVHNIADDKRTGCRRVFQGGRGGVVKPLVWDEYVEVGRSYRSQ